MEINLVITEGMVYDAVKGGVENFLGRIKSQLKEQQGEAYTDRTGNLRSSVGYEILRNGNTIDDESIKPLRDKPIEGVKYSAVVAVGIGESTKTVVINL